MTESIVSGNFTFRRTKLAGVIVVEPKVYGDARGFFMETYKRDDFVKGGITAHFVQDNQSHSVKGVIRGLHFQKRFPQAKLIRVLAGRIFDVAVDLRPESPTYGQWTASCCPPKTAGRCLFPEDSLMGFGCCRRRRILPISAMTCGIRRMKGASCGMIRRWGLRGRRRKAKRCLMSEVWC